MKIIGWLEIVNDYGERRYSVTRIQDGCYYFAEKTLLENHKLRYNKNEGRIEEYKPDADMWDVFDQYIYQADFIRN